jgi:pyroglutamyl-peptidase
MQRRLNDAQQPASPRVLPRLLLTGFGPFPGVPDNASAILVDALAKRLRAEGAPIDLRIEILPTEWKAAPDLVQLALKDFKPDVALHFGVASETTRFRLETLAQNARNRLGDAQGHVHRRRRISAILPDQLLATFPADAIHGHLEAIGVPVELSCDAGQYLCNATLFRSLGLSLKARGAAVTGFIHIPSQLADGDQACSLQVLTWSHAITGGLAIVETCLAHAAQFAGQRTAGPAGVSI